MCSFQLSSKEKGGYIFFNLIEFLQAGKRSRLFSALLFRSHIRKYGHLAGSYKKASFPVFAMRGRNEAQELFLIPVVPEIARRGHTDVEDGRERAREETFLSVFRGNPGKESSREIALYCNFRETLPVMEIKRKRGGERKGDSRDIRRAFAG